MVSRLKALLRQSFATLRRHPIVTALLAIVALAWLAFGLIIGGAPFFAFLLFIVAGCAWGALMLGRRLRRNRPEQDKTSSARRDGLMAMGVVGLVALVIFGLAQLVPYGRPQAATAGTGEPAWATPRTRELMVNACYSCHSNAVEYPWYSSIAPVSWTVQHHIDEGRDAVNYSNFATDPGDADNSIEVIREGSMPPGYFTAFGMHPEAKLSEAEKAELIAGLEATPGLRDGGGTEHNNHDDDGD